MMVIIVMIMIMIMMVITIIVMIMIIVIIIMIVKRLSFFSLICGIRRLIHTQYNSPSQKISSDVFLGDQGGN